MLDETAVSRETVQSDDVRRENSGTGCLKFPYRMHGVTMRQPKRNEPETAEKIEGQKRGYAKSKHMYRQEEEPKTAEKMKGQKRRRFARCCALLGRISGWRRRGRRGRERLPRGTKELEGIGKRDCRKTERKRGWKNEDRWTRFELVPSGKP